jgi:hypothetical protein
MQEVSSSCNTNGYRTFFPVQPTQVVKVNLNGQVNFQFNGFCYFDKNLGPGVSSQPSFTYSAQMANGDALPSWITFTPLTRTFTGTPPSIGKLYFTMIATLQFQTDSNGFTEVNSVASTFVING